MWKKLFWQLDKSGQFTCSLLLCMQQRYCQEKKHLNFGVSENVQKSGFFLSEHFCPIRQNAKFSIKNSHGGNLGAKLDFWAPWEMCSQGRPSPLGPGGHFFPFNSGCPPLPPFLHPSSCFLSLSSPSPFFPFLLSFLFFSSIFSLFLETGPLEFS